MIWGANNGRYILDGKVAVECEDLLTWATWIERERATIRVAYDRIDWVRISTVFLGLDHNFADDGPPLVFETMVFGGTLDNEQWFYSTWGEAEVGHASVVAQVKRARWLTWLKFWRWPCWHRLLFRLWKLARQP